MESVTAIVGPTASGKTAHAIELAKELNGAVISADSRQVYAGMDIGTAKPEPAWRTEAHTVLTPDTVEGIPHYLLNVRPPNEPLQLSDWQTAAFKAIELIRAQGQHPIIAGGTMLYVDSLLFNYDIPNVPPNEELRAALEQKTAEELYGLLEEKDPAAINFIEPHNKRRIIRALEVIDATGKTFSQLRRKRRPTYDFAVTGLFPGWNALEQRIAKRAGQMLTGGLLEETQTLRQRYGQNLPLLKTMNYVEAATILDGSMPKKEALDQMIRANLRYARRQMSWWRGRDEIRWIAATS